MKYLILLLLSLPVSAYEAFLVDKVVSIYDGDSFRAHVYEWPPLIGNNISIRINGIDAAEIRGECPEEKLLAKQAKAVTERMLRNAEVIEVRNPQRGKYFRILGDVYADGVSIADELIRLNLARPYDGGKRKGWCHPEPPFDPS